VADPNPSAPAPTDDQPTWTVDENGLQVDGWRYVHATLLDVRGRHCVASANQEAALVEAVHRSQQLDTALDVVAMLDDGYVDGGDGHWWTVDQDGCPYTQMRPITDAERAVLALAERRHRD